MFLVREWNAFLHSLLSADRDIGRLERVKGIVIKLYFVIGDFLCFVEVLMFFDVSISNISHYIGYRIIFNIIILKIYYVVTKSVEFCRIKYLFVI